MDPVSAIANAVGNIFGGIIGIFQTQQQQKALEYSQLPHWLEYEDFQDKKDNTFLYIILLLLIAIVVVAWIKNK